MHSTIPPCHVIVQFEQQRVTAFCYYGFSQHPPYSTSDQLTSLVAFSLLDSNCQLPQQLDLAISVFGNVWIVITLRTLRQLSLPSAAPVKVIYAPQPLFTAVCHQAGCLQGGLKLGCPAPALPTHLSASPNETRDTADATAKVMVCLPAGKQWLSISITASCLFFTNLCEKNMSAH